MRTYVRALWCAYHDILWLEISMDQRILVEIIQPLYDVSEEFLNRLFW
jgi:hypothetical protein